MMQSFSDVLLFSAETGRLCLFKATFLGTSMYRDYNKGPNVPKSGQIRSAKLMYKHI